MPSSSALVTLDMVEAIFLSTTMLAAVEWSPLGELITGTCPLLLISLVRGRVFLLTMSERVSWVSSVDM